MRPQRRGAGTGGSRPRSDAAPLHAFALGERRKNLRTFGAVLETLAGALTDRRTLIVGVGGGVAGDLFGFAAATYARGVPFVNVATSLVAMVDAAIGGKTGVDLAAGKNLAGAFADPVAVFCDLGALATLPRAAACARASPRSSSTPSSRAARRSSRSKRWRLTRCGAGRGRRSSPTRCASRR